MFKGLKSVVESVKTVKNLAIEGAKDKLGSLKETINTKISQEGIEKNNQILPNDINSINERIKNLLTNANGESYKNLVPNSETKYYGENGFTFIVKTDELGEVNNIDGLPFSIYDDDQKNKFISIMNANHVISKAIHKDYINSLTDELSKAKECIKIDNKKLLENQEDLKGLGEIEVLIKDNNLKHKDNIIDHINNGNSSNNSEKILKSINFIKENINKLTNLKNKYILIKSESQNGLNLQMEGLERLIETKKMYEEYESENKNTDEYIQHLGQISENQRYSGYLIEKYKLEISKINNQIKLINISINKENKSLGELNLLIHKEYKKIEEAHENLLKSESVISLTKQKFQPVSINDQKINFMTEIKELAS